MKRFMLLHVGFEPPTPEIMNAWNAWFESVADRAVEHGGFRSTREITREGSRDLPMDTTSATGYSIIEAESLDEAEAIARDNPFITAIRIHEVMSHG